MAEHTTQERTEQATPRRRREARRKGTVARSADLTSAVAISALALLLPFFASALCLGLLNSMRAGLSVSNVRFTTDSIIAHLTDTVAPLLPGLVPVACIALIAGTAAGFMQVGFHPTAELLNPNFDRINPITGFKRLFSRMAAFEFAKTVVKLALISYICYAEIASNWDGLLNLSNLQGLQAVAWLGGVLSAMLLKFAIAWIILGILDYAFQRRQVERQIMMTKDELKRELRETETSPELRAELQRRRRRLARARMMRNVKQADVVITNPLEYAVALKYDRKKAPAPVVLAKGRFLMAERIRAEAKKARVPIIPNPPLARSLYQQVEVGDTIPTTLFQAVAEVLAFVFKMRGRKP